MTFSIRFRLALLGMLTSCAEPPFEKTQIGPIPELSRISQDPIYHLQRARFLPQTSAQRERLYHNFVTAYFSIWRQDSPERPTIYRTPVQFRAKLQKCFAENFYPWSDSYQAVQKNVVFSDKNLGLKALTTRNTPLRFCPSVAPCFFDSKNIAGEGYPFDYNQEDYVYVGTPLRVIDFSVDQLWALVWTNASAYGWIQVKDFVVLTESEAASYVQNRFGVVTKDRQSLLAPGYVDRVLLGTIVPLSQNGALVPVRTEQGRLALQEVMGTAAFIQPIPLPWTMPTVAFILKQLVNQVYGWGSLAGNRDCSAMLKSYFAVFGHHLPRDSTPQALEAPQSQTLDHLAANEKADYVSKFGIPFQTSVRLKGHVMLYVGTHPEYGPLYFHNRWGLHTQRGAEQGRFVIGRSVFTSGHPSDNMEAAGVLPMDFTAELTHMMQYRMC